MKHRPAVRRGAGVPRRAGGQSTRTGMPEPVLIGAAMDAKPHARPFRRLCRLAVATTPRGAIGQARQIAQDHFFRAVDRLPGFAVFGRGRELETGDLDPLAVAHARLDLRSHALPFSYFQQ